MIHCPNTECNSENPAGAKFCRKCGAAFTPANRYKQMINSAGSSTDVSSVMPCLTGLWWLLWHIKINLGITFSNH